MAEHCVKLAVFQENKHGTSLDSSSNTCREFLTGSKLSCVDSQAFTKKDDEKFLTNFAFGYTLYRYRHS